MRRLRSKKLAEQVMLEVSEHLPEKYTEIDLNVKYKYGDVSECGYVINAKLPDENFSIDIPIEPLAQKLDIYKSIDMLSEAVSGRIKEYAASKDILNSVDISDFNAVKEYLSVQLVNKRQNTLLLLDHPYKVIGDMVEVCYIKLPMMSKIIGSGYYLKVTNNMVSGWGISQSELLRFAEDNMMKMERPIVCSLEKFALSYGEIGKYEFTENIFDNNDIFTSDPYGAYILSNENFRYGAASIISKSVLEKLEKGFPEGYYMLPMSVNEVLLYSADFGYKEEDLQNMLLENNRCREGKAHSGFLSNTLYKYDMQLHKLCSVKEINREFER